MKCEATQELVVGGFTDPQGRRVGLGALLVGYFDGADFVFAGKVGTGLDTARLLELRARLDRLQVTSPPFTRGTGLPRAGAHWARPEVVVQVAFTEWTVHGKLRHPRLLGVPRRQGSSRRRAGAAMITHPDKVLFPSDGITKGELAAYYDAVAPVMLPHLRRRPITMERFPGGIDAKGFIQKDVSRGHPPWLQRVEAPKKGGVVRYPLAGDRRSLQWLANQNAVTLHVWPSRAPRLDRPDLCVLDLDPSRDEPGELREAMLALRLALQELGHASWVKTSGSKGFHVAVPMPARATFDDSSTLADRIAALLVDRHPRTLTREFAKADRDGRIYLDTGRNRAGATFAAAYTVRARPGAPVSAPCTWEEVEAGAVHPQSFTLRTMRERLAGVGDLWADLRRPSSTRRSTSSAARPR